MKTLIKSSKLNSIAVIGNYLPRKCGIATFTTDLCNSMVKEMGGQKKVSALAMDDIDDGYPYPKRVEFELRSNKISEYLRAADFLNVHRYDIVILQHEYGIFGGPNGSHILMLLKNLNMPVMTTLHTILENPSTEQKTIIMDIAKYSEGIVVLSGRGKEILKRVYNIPESSISFIHHGIPDIGFEDPYFHKETFGIEERSVLLSFGLLHPGKGIEYVIQALPDIVAKHPEVIYIILGATHPTILRETGDAYRQSLHQLVNRLDLKEHVQFKNKFVDLEELCQYIGAADIYLTPYISGDQIASGTLAYTVGAGKAIISTRYKYAEEVLADNRGRLVAFKNSEEIAQAVNDLLGNPKKRNSMRRRAYQYGRSMVWKEVARRYLSLAAKIISSPITKTKTTYSHAPIPGSVDELPEVKLHHLRIMTDGVGMLQHANYSIPDRNHGYCIDDNARALIAASMYYTLYKDESLIPLIKTYLSFLFHAFNKDNKRFINFMSYERDWLEKKGSEDSHGRTLWGLGTVIKHAPEHSILHMASRLFVDGLDRVTEFTFPRAWAFTLVGLHSYLEIYSGDVRVRNLRKVLAERLFALFKKNSDKDWPWFEETATYANAKLPQALILAGQWIPDTKMFDAGIRSLRWLIDVQTSKEGHLSVIGNNGWFTKGGKQAKFDQQPIEAMNIIDACAEAYRSTGNEKWLRDAKMAMNWFLGRNDLNTVLYDFKSGGCCDGIESHGANSNQGAESTLAGLISLLTIQKILGIKTLRD